MLAAVREARPGTVHNAVDAGAEGTVRAALKSRAKLAYYYAFAALYGAVGRLAHVVMVNSSWTRAHVAALWGGDPTVVFPPCDTATLALRPLEPREALVVSVAQFRPEKDHSLQLRAFAMLKKRRGGGGKKKKKLEGQEDECDDEGAAAAAAARIDGAKLALVGSCRGADDEARVAALRAECAALGLVDGVDVSFHLNVTFGELQAFLGRGVAGTLCCRP